MTTQRCVNCGKEFNVAPYKAEWCEACLKEHFDVIEQMDEYDQQERARAYYADLMERRARAIADGVSPEILIPGPNDPHYHAELMKRRARAIADGVPREILISDPSDISCPDDDLPF